MKKTEINVEMVGDGPVNIRFSQHILGTFRFGKEVKVSPKANACFNKEGYKAEYFTETVSVCIGIGKDHTAELIMTKAAWNALNDGAVVFTTTTEEFKRKYIYKKK